MKAKSMIYSQERRRVNQVGVVATLAVIGGIMLAAVAASGNIGNPKSEATGVGGEPNLDGVIPVGTQLSTDFLPKRFRGQDLTLVLFLDPCQECTLQKISPAELEACANSKTLLVFTKSPKQNPFPRLSSIQLPSDSGLPSLLTQMNPSVVRIDRHGVVQEYGYGRSGVLKVIGDRK